MDARFALVCSVLANINRDAKKRPKPYDVYDFMPKERQTEKELKNKIAQLMQYVKVINNGI